MPCPMVLALRLALALALACAAVPACSTQGPAGARMEVSAASRQENEWAARLHREVNAYRAARGKAVLKRHAGLDELARQHNLYLRANQGKFKLHGEWISHDGFEYRCRVAARDYRMLNLSENVAASGHKGEREIAKLVEIWAASSGHRSNMESNWEYTGLSVVRTEDGMLLATQLFGVPNIGAAPVREAFGEF